MNIWLDLRNCLRLEKPTVLLKGDLNRTVKTPFAPFSIFVGLRYAKTAAKMQQYTWNSIAITISDFSIHKISLRCASPTPSTANKN